MQFVAPTLKFSDFILNTVNIGKVFSILPLCPCPPSSKLQGERHMGQRSLERSSQAYDKAIVSRIGNPPRSAGGLSSDDPTSPSRTQDSFKRLNNGQLKPLNLPERQHSSSDDPSKWSAVLTSPSTLSPGLPLLPAWPPVAC